MFVIRLYDGFDNQWIDVCEPITREQADKKWADLTEGGTKMSKFDDIDYYAVFPANTKMLYSDGFGER